MKTPTFLIAAATALYGLAGSALAQDASLTVLHGVPGLPGPVEVVANGGTLFSFCYGEQRGPLALPPGQYAVEVQLDGATILSDTYTLNAGDDVSVIANLDANGAPKLSPFGNDGSALTLPASRLTVRHTAEAPAVDIVVLQNGSQVLSIDNVTNGQQATTDVPPGDYEVELRLAGTPTVAFGPVPVTVEDGFRYGVFAVGQALTPNFDLLVQRDALTAQVRSMEGLQFGNVTPSLFLDGVEVLSLDQLVEGPVAIQPGTYDAEFRAFNGSSTLVDGGQITLEAGDDTTLLPFLGFGTALLFGEFDNDVSALALSRNARVTVRHTAFAPEVDVIVSQNGSTVATIAGLVNGDEAVAELPAGTYDVAIAPAGTTTPVFGPVSLQFAARTNTIAQALGELGTSFTVGVDVIDLAGVPQPSEVLVRTFGSGCGPTITAERNCAMFGETIRVAFENGLANDPAVLFFGLDNASVGAQPLPLDGATFGSPGCTIYTDFAGFVFRPADVNGRATFDLALPRALAASFGTVYVQGIQATPNTGAHFQTSNALAIERN